MLRNLYKYHIYFLLKIYCLSNTIKYIYNIFIPISPTATAVMQSFWKRVVYSGFPSCCLCEYRNVPCNFPNMEPKDCFTKTIMKCLEQVGQKAESLQYGFCICHIMSPYVCMFPYLILPVLLLCPNREMAEGSNS